MSIACECGEQRLVTKDVDAPRQAKRCAGDALERGCGEYVGPLVACGTHAKADVLGDIRTHQRFEREIAVSYTHLRAHETVLDLVCRLLLEQKKLKHTKTTIRYITIKCNTEYLTPHHSDTHIQHTLLEI